MSNIFIDIGLIIIIATVGGYLVRLFKQPLIPAYIIVGIIIGPILKIVTDTSVLATLSEIGIAFLLFMVGLELDLKKLRDVGALATAGALVQMVVLFAAGYLASYFLGLSHTTAIYMGVVMALSSTMVVIKIFSNRRELDTLHGRIVIGILLMQDLIAILALTFLQSLGEFSAAPIIFKMIEGVALLAFAILVGKMVFPAIFKFAAKSQELLFLVSISVCFLFALLFNQIGFSIAVGAFIAGITLGNLPYNLEIVGKVTSLRDFFAVLFFVTIGAELVLVDFSIIIIPLVAFLLIKLIILPLILIIISSVYGYKRKVAFQTGTSLAQISEFSLILIAGGLLLGHVTTEIYALVILLAVVTMLITPYLINYNDKLYKLMGPLLKPFEKLSRKNRELAHIEDDTVHDVVLVGYDRIGYTIFRQLQKLKKKTVVVDYNPDIIKRLIANKTPCVYGEVTDPEVMEKLRLKTVKMVISTIPGHTENLLLIKKVKSIHKDIIMIVTGYHVEEALSLYEAGADYVVLPHLLGGEHVSLLLEDISVDLDKLITTKLAHIKELKHRQGVHPHHR
jgi:Kef-type K+ transport system membrane component KefB